jgi:hypothetical protein
MIDADQVAGLAGELAASFPFDRARDCRLVALATRRAAPFCLALGYEDSAVYLRRIRPDGG